LLFSVLSPGCYRWLFPLCYSTASGVKKSELSRPKLVWSLFFRCIISDISRRLETPGEAIARGPA
jgi:hypothetical protein